MRDELRHSTSIGNLSGIKLFTSIIFEDFDSMVTASINRAREGKEEAESPLESIIKM